jgi:integrase/recombinase XerD
MDLLFDDYGNRKYLTAEERRIFEKAAKEAEPAVRTLCLTLLNTGCRISEAINLKVRNIDFAAKAITFETLKQKKRAYRQVPISTKFLDELNLVHQLKSRQANKKNAEQRIFETSRATASRRIDEVMKAANITGIIASSKGLRHGFAVACVEEKIPLNLIQKWLGHSYIITTAIYANVLGKEERNLIKGLWQQTEEGEE